MSQQVVERKSWPPRPDGTANSRKVAASARRCLGWLGMDAPEQGNSGRWRLQNPSRDKGKRERERERERGERKKREREREKEKVSRAIRTRTVNGPRRKPSAKTPSSSSGRSKHTGIPSRDGQAYAKLARSKTRTSGQHFCTLRFEGYGPVVTS